MNSSKATDYSSSWFVRPCNVDLLGFPSKTSIATVLSCSVVSKGRGEKSGYRHRVLNFKGSLQLSQFFILVYILSQDQLPLAQRKWRRCSRPHTPVGTDGEYVMHLHISGLSTIIWQSSLSFHFHKYAPRQQA